MIWAIELTIGFARWRELTGNPDEEQERLRWVKMCHRLGSSKAIEIVVIQQTVDRMSRE